MPPRLLLLAGAPPASVVEEASCTVKSFEAPFHALVGLGPDDVCLLDCHHHRRPQATIAPWRSIFLLPRPLRTGFSPAAHRCSPPSFLDRRLHHDAFFSSASLLSSSSRQDGSSGQDEAVLDEFCEQSLARHHSPPSPDGLGHDEGVAMTASQDDTSFLLDSTIITTTSSNNNIAGEPPPAPPDISPAHLSRLQDVPTAKRIASLQPQTVTVNLIVGILSVAQPRFVTTRWGQKLSLLEILVGDDTRSGFAVTFWRSNDAAAAAMDLAALRRQDVVLLQNVALHIFRDKVYGQSLRRGQTKVHLLWTRRQDVRACYSSATLANTLSGLEANAQLVRTRMVRDWVIAFVGIDPRMKSFKDQQHVWDRPPDDTQD